jgi:hypothetical protein
VIWTRSDDGVISKAAEPGYEVAICLVQMSAFSVKSMTAFGDR